jgi:hypothetical protein
LPGRAQGALECVREAQLLTGDGERDALVDYRQFGLGQRREGRVVDRRFDQDHLLGRELANACYQRRQMIGQRRRVDRVSTQVDQEHAALAQLCEGLGFSSREGVLPKRAWRRSATGSRARARPRTRSSARARTAVPRRLAY